MVGYLPVPPGEPRQPRRHGVVVTTLLVLVTVCVIFPLLVLGGCGLLAGLLHALGGGQ